MFPKKYHDEWYLLPTMGFPIDYSCTNNNGYHRKLKVTIFKTLKIICTQLLLGLISMELVDSRQKRIGAISLSTLSLTVAVIIHAIM